MHKAQLIWFCEKILETLATIKDRKLSKEKADKKMVTNIQNIRKNQSEVIECRVCKKDIGKDLLKGISFFNKTAYVLYKRIVNVKQNVLNFDVIKKCMAKIIRLLDTPNAKEKWTTTLEIFNFGIRFDINDEASRMQLTVFKLELDDDMDNLVFLDFITSINQSWSSLTK